MMRDRSKYSDMSELDRRAFLRGLIASVAVTVIPLPVGMIRPTKKFFNFVGKVHDSYLFETDFTEVELRVLLDMQATQADLMRIYGRRITPIDAEELKSLFRYEPS